MVRDNLATSRSAGTAGLQPARMYSVDVKYKDSWMRTARDLI